MKSLETDRLIIRPFELDDRQYILKQLNEESFIKNIADKHVRSLSDAENYLKSGPLASYKTHGFGLNIVVLKDANLPIGMCGLVNREELKHPDLGFAFLPEYWGQNYAMESSKAVLRDAAIQHQLARVLGITLPSNQASNKLLMKLGFVQKGTISIYQSLNNLYEYNQILDD